MNDDVVIKAEHISKKYCKSMKRSMLYGIQDIGRNLLGLSSCSDKLRASEFWAVNDISFELKKGEALGLIGPNGCGKSTLLKLLNGIFWPDKGKITVKGRVGALIEVGAGFHPLLTGRENIYINGAILGMNREEIDAKFEDIIEFADIGDFIDAPVKSYSSGMFVRLGFAVAIHCQPDILLVDEVLSVGDAVFRNKCFQRMNEIKSGKKASIIFVSHDLYTVERFCDNALFLIQGKFKGYGEAHQVISNYQYAIMQSLPNSPNTLDIAGLPYCTKEIELISVSFLGSDGEKREAFNFRDTLRIKIEYQAKNVVYNPRFEVEIKTQDGQMLSVSGPHLDNAEISRIDRGHGVIECRIKSIPLLANKYCVNVGVFDKTRTIHFDWWQSNVHPELAFIILPTRATVMMGQYSGVCHFDSCWMINGKELDFIPIKE